jgi:hypothetical protein
MSSKFESSSAVAVRRRHPSMHAVYIAVSQSHMLSNEFCLLMLPVGMKSLAGQPAEIACRQPTEGSNDTSK